MKKIILFILIVTLAFLCAQKLPISGVTEAFLTDKGYIRCAKFADRTECLGIPYAAPPTGNLRFRPPVPMDSWSGVRDATKVSSPCLQAKTEYIQSQCGSEDCLYLNVYIPSAGQDTTKLPVMVWLHGGGFVNGSGNAFSGAYLAQTAKVIVVTVNYRLGPFGWLALPSLAAETRDGTTGNYGLLDSIAALKWVQKNIENFGGDKDRVTLFGQSAGAEQTFALLASPYAKGLFHRAISMSTPATLKMPTVKQSAARRGAFLAELGCTDSATQADCLRRQSAQRILDASHISWDLIAQLGLQFTATVDGAVLPDQWLKLFREGAFNKMPVIIGHTRDEGRLFTVIHENNLHAPITRQHVEERSRAFFKLAANSIIKKYPEKDYAAPGDGMAQVITDALFVAGEQHHREALARYVPVYGYQSCDPEAPESHVHAHYSKLGCAHDSDLPYLFQWDDHSGKRPDFTPDQLRLARQMGRYWGNFAYSGDPNGSGMPLWPKFLPGGDQIQLLEPAGIGGVRSSVAGAYTAAHKLDFWGTLATIQKSVKWALWIAVILIAAGVFFVFFRRYRKAHRT